MIKTNVIKSAIISTLLFTLLCCATPPDKPVSLQAFSAMGINKLFEYDYPGEYLLKHLNEKGVVVFEARKKDGAKKRYYIKILATPTGPVAETYPIE